MNSLCIRVSPKVKYFYGICKRSSNYHSLSWRRNTIDECKPLIGVFNVNVRSQPCFNINLNSGYCLRHVSTLMEPETTDEASSEDLSKGKIHTELENEVFHTYLENSPNYSETVHKPDTELDEYVATEEEFIKITRTEDWTQISASEYFCAFAKVAKHCQTSLHRISDPIFKPLCDAFPSKSVHFNDYQLIKIFMCLKIWPNAPGVKDENFLKVWKSLDAECLVRRPNWGYKSTLYMIDMWYSLNLTRLSLYVQKSVIRLIDKARRLSPHDLVQLMFYLNTLRKVPKSQSLFEVEYQLSKVIKLFTIDEIAIISAGYFKTQSNVTPASAEMIDNIINILLDHKDTISPVNLATILKFIRYTHKNENANTVIKMLDELSPTMDQNTLQVNIHLALVCVTKRIYHPQTINNLIECFLLAPGVARLKDIGKIAELIFMFNVSNDLSRKACEVIISELESENRESEIQMFSRSLLWCLCYLSFNKTFSEQLTSKVLENSFIKSVYATNYSIENKLLQLDQNVELLYPGYNKNRLPTDLVSYLFKRFSSWVPGKFNSTKSGTTFEVFLVKFINVLKEVCGDDDNHWLCTHLLLHFPNPDVIIHIDENKNFLNIPSELRKKKSSVGYTPAPSVPGRLVVFVPCIKFHFTHDLQLIGEQTAKLEQLKSIGYTPVVVPFSGFSHSNTLEKRVEYVKEIINSL